MPTTKELARFGVAILLGVLLTFGVLGLGKVWYYVKVVRVADRVLRGVEPPPPLGQHIPIAW